MMRRRSKLGAALLSFLGVFGLSTTSQGQVLFTETFTGGVSTAGFTINQSVGTCGWDYTNPGARAISGAGFDADFAIFDSDDCGSGQNDAELISPTFDASTGSTFELDYDQQYRYCCSSVATVEVWDGAVWNVVTTLPAASVDYPNPAGSVNIDITAATGGSAAAQVRFVYGADFAWWWALDNISVTEIACTAPTATASTTLDCVGGTYTVTVDVTALGDAADVDITSTANGGVIPGGDDVGTGMYTTPAIPLGTSTDITVVHNGDPTCNLSLGTFVQNTTDCPIDTYPYCETFDSFTTCSTSATCGTGCTLENGWSNVGVESWRTDAGGTPSGGTGPSDDITGGGNYLYMETSTPQCPDDRIAESPLFSIGALNAGNGAEVSLNYHMFGPNIGDFEVEVEDVTNSPGTFSSIFSATGDQGDMWNSTGWLDLSGFTGPLVRIRVTGTNATTYQGDMAFDEVCIREQLACTPPTAGTPTIVPNCAMDNFTIEVDLTGLGDATDVDITEDVNGGGASVVHDDVSALMVYSMGPYSNGDNVDIVIVHNGDPACNLNLGTVNGTLNCASQGVCGLGLSIPDAACPTTTDFIVSVTSAGTALGTDIFLGSIDLIFSHTFNSDLEIRLTNPNGTPMDLILDRFGSGDNLGDPANCPTDVLTLMDGGAALTTTATSNVTGTFEPEQLLSTMHDGSDPNGSWLLRVCDDAGGDLGALEYIQINLVSCQAPSATATVVPDCGSNQFTVDVDLTALGTATDVDISSDLLGVEHDDVSGLMVYSMGPYPSGSTVNITVVHNQDNSCNLSLASQTFECPPVNDVCGGAIAVGCNSITSGNTSTATNGDNPGTCDTDLSTAPGLWYTITPPSDGDVTAALCGSSYDTKLGIFDGSGGCGALVCIEGEDDDFTDCGDNDGFITWAATGGTTYYIYVTGFSTGSGDFDLEVVCAPATPPCTENEVTMELNTDDFGSETSWEIIPQGNNIPVCSGAGGYPDNATITETCCLFDGCYRLRVEDSFGDGMGGGANGAYRLLDPNGDRIIDQPEPGDFGSLSAIANDGGFCLPLGTDRLTIGSCDRMDYLANDFIVAAENPAVTAEFGVNDANSGYQFYIFDPNGTYARLIFLSHANPGVGAPPGPTAAAHVRSSTMASSPLPTDLLLNVRVRGRVNGVNSEFGPTCTIKILSAPAACPTTKLIDDPNNQFFSCGVTGLVLDGSDKIVAFPVAGANKYQFRFENAGEGYTRLIAINNYALVLTEWATSPLEYSKTYDVQVRASFDNGANYCPFGDVCMITTAPVPPATASARSLAIGPNAEATLWPNPNRGDVVNLMLTDLNKNVETADVDIYDAFGKRVSANTYATQDGMLNVVMELNNELPSGLYMVQITAGEQTLVERLVIQ